MTVSTLTTTSGVQTVTLPADYQEFLALSIDGDPLEFIPADRLRARGTDDSRTPRFFSIEGDLLLLSPLPAEAETIEIKYYAKVPALASTSTNWLLTKFPNIYLYASLVSGYHYVKNEQKADYYGSLYAQAVAVAKTDDQRATHSGSPMVVRARQ